MNFDFWLLREGVQSPDRNLMGFREKIIVLRAQTELWEHPEHRYVCIWTVYTLSMIYTAVYARIRAVDAEIDHMPCVSSLIITSLIWRRAILLSHPFRC